MISPIEITEEAQQKFFEKLADRTETRIRIGLKGGGCSGFSYVIMFDAQPLRESDINWSVGGVEFAVDKKSLLHLSGAQISWKQTFIGEGFEFTNPHEVTRCGCGTSFDVK